MAANSPKAEPVLRWAGSKRKLLADLLKIANLEPIHHYVEPFAGSACLFFALGPKVASLSDINPELIHFYQMARRQPRQLHRSTLSIAESDYYEVRALLPERLSPIERAARFYFLNRHCFNGLYRTNKAGQFNVPKGRRTGAIPSEDALVRASRALREANLLEADFEEAKSHAAPGTFFYFDPPYDYSGRRDRGDYGPKQFRLSDLDRLSRLLNHINRKGGRFLLSYLETPEVQDLRRRWSSQAISVRRQISGFPENRRAANELLIWNQP